jgi:hypothetical protein
MDEYCLTLMGTPLNPLGKLNMIDYYLASSTLEQQYKKFIGGKFQIVYSGGLMYIIIYCITASNRMLIKKSQYLVS